MTDRVLIEHIAPSRPRELGCHLFIPDRARSTGVAPLVVAVHGISLNALEQVESFAAHASARGAVVLAPCFDTPEDRDYQRLGRRAFVLSYAQRIGERWQDDAAEAALLLRELGAEEWFYRLEDRLERRPELRAVSA